MTGRGGNNNNVTSDMLSDSYYFMELTRDVKGFSVGPHTDSQAKWVTTLFYLPRDRKLVGKGGTLVGKFKDGRKQTGGSTWQSFDGFVPVRRAAFEPNSALAFAPCHTSWHAVEAMGGAVVRDTIQGFISSETKRPKKAC